MELIAIVTGLAVLQAFFFAFQVGGARVKFGVDAPAISGNPDFERVFRVHANTVEQLVIFLPGLWMFGYYVNAMIGAGLDTADFTMDVDIALQPGELEVTNNTNADAAFSFAATRGTGGLAGLTSVNVITLPGAAAALTAVEGFIQTAVDAQAAFGTGEHRIEIQNEFMNTLIDSFKSGIGALVDADLEAAASSVAATYPPSSSAGESA